MIYAVYIFDKALKSLSDKMAFYDLLFNTIVVQKKIQGQEFYNIYQEIECFPVKINYFV